MTSPRNVLVTGASRGIGLLTVKTLAKAGYHAIAAMRDPVGRNAAAATELKSWAAENNYSLEVVEMDVTSDDSVNKAIHSLEERLNIDVLVNNAGIMPVGISEAYTPSQITELFDVNLVGIVRTCRAVLPYMRKRKSGLLMHLSSNAGRLAMPFFGAYCSSKWAVEALCESMHYELQPFGIETVIVEPGGHSTDLVVTAPTPSDKECLASYGSVAEGPDKVLNAFKGMFAQGDSSTDAQNVADKIHAVIAMESPRPIRAMVGQSMGIDHINANTAPVQQEFLKMFLPMAGLAS